MTAFDEARPPNLEPEYFYVRPITGGTGGYSNVYIYRQSAPIREVAVKVLRGSAAIAGFQAIQDEATATAVLGNHAHIVQVIAARPSDDGQPCIIMQYCPGGNLMQTVAAGPLDLKRVVEIGSQIAGAVQAAHAKGIIHRDIKPANILVDEYGKPRLTDFGIAGLLGAEADTSVGISLPWCPPEMLDTATGDAASDIYSLGATLWHLLAGRPPFFDRTGTPTRAELERRTRHMPVPPVGRSDVPPDLDRLLARMMAKQPTERPRSAAQVVAELSAIEYRLGSTYAAAPPTPVPPPSSVSPPAAPIPTAVPTDTTARPSGSQPARESALGATGVRPQPEVDEQPSAVDGEGPPSRRTLVATLTAIAVLILGGVGFVVLRPSSDRTTGTPSSVDSQVGAPNGGDELPPGPVSVTAVRVDTQTLRFTWTYSAPLDNDTFQWRTSTGDQHGTAEKPTLDLADPAGTRLCVQIKVARASGQFGALDWSQPGCGT